MPKRKTQPAASAAAAPRATKAKHGMQLLPRDVDHLSTVQRARLSFEPPLPPSMASLGTGERAGDLRGVSAARKEREREIVGGNMKN